MDYQLEVFRVVKQVKTDSHIPIHAHADYYQYMYVIGGKGVIYSKSKGYTARERSLFMFAPGEEHGIYGVDRFNAIDIKFRCGKDLAGLIDFGTCVVENLSTYESTLIQDIFDEAVLGRPNFDHMINALMFTLLMMLSRRVHPQANVSEDRIHPITTSDSDINSALDYIHRNLTSQISISDLAASIGFSPSYFSTVFKQKTGYVPNQYINIRRVELAKSLILSSDWNITEISDHLGFESLHYFSRVFKKYVGISPKYYYKRANSSAGITIAEGKQIYSNDQFQFPLEKGDLAAPQK